MLSLGEIVLMFVMEWGKISLSVLMFSYILLLFVGSIFVVMSIGRA